MERKGAISRDVWTVMGNLFGNRGEELEPVNRSPFFTVE
jgi:hypothetical protein